MLGRPKDQKLRSTLVSWVIFGEVEMQKTQEGPDFWGHVPGCAGYHLSATRPAGQTRTNRACFSDDGRNKLPQTNLRFPKLPKSSIFGTFWRSGFDPFAYSGEGSGRSE